MNKLIPIFICFILVIGNAHSTTVEALTLKATFILKFIPFIEFPSMPSSYKVGFLGKKENLQEFNAVFEGKVHDNIKFEVIGLDSRSDISKINILYIEANTFPPNLSDVKALIISSDKNGIEKGANINFLILGESVKFEINQQKSQESGFKISSRLLNLATRVVQ